MARLWLERSGALNKLIPIIKKLLDTRQLSYESTVQETKEVWLSRSDSFFKFKNEMIVQRPNHIISVSILKNSYHKFCGDNGMTTIKDSIFFNKIKELLNNTPPAVHRVDGKSTRVWNGLTINSELRSNSQETID